MKIKALKHTVTAGERWDTLAWRYYGDPFAYGKIIEANPALNIAAVLPEGVTVLVPLLTVAQQTAQRSAARLPFWKR
jgi:phage tail protein X